MLFIFVGVTATISWAVMFHVIVILTPVSAGGMMALAGAVALLVWSIYILGGFVYVVLVLFTVAPIFYATSCIAFMSSKWWIAL